MSFSAGYRARVLLGDFSLSAFLESFDPPLSTDMLDVTTFENAGTGGSKRTIPGQDSSSVSMSGWFDTDGSSDGLFDQLVDLRTLGTPEPLTYGPAGLSVGSQVTLMHMLEGTFTTSTQTSSAVAFSLDGISDGATDYGVSLADHVAVTGDTNGTSVDNTVVSTTGGGVAHLHVTAFSGFSGVVVTVEDSANNSVWATIGTFATAAGLTSERLAIAGTIRRYTRCVIDVTGTGSITCAVALARR